MDVKKEIKRVAEQCEIEEEFYKKTSIIFSVLTTFNDDNNLDIHPILLKKLSAKLATTII